MNRKIFVRLQEVAILAAAVNFLMSPVQLYVGNPLVGLGNFFVAIGLVALVVVTDRYERRTTWEKIRKEFLDGE